MNGRQKLRQLLAQPGVIQAGGVGDAGQALLVENVGYPAVYISGSYVNHTRGYPDGTLTLTEMAARIGEIADRVQIPVIADADEGFGGTLKIIRTVKEYEKAGAAALHLEDMSLKKHGHPMPVKDMLRNLEVALNARTDPNLAIIARTDSVAPWRKGLDQNLAACEEEAFERSMLYAEAGADVLMPLFVSSAWIKKYGNRLAKPLLLLTPELSAAELEPHNVKIILYPASMLSRSFVYMKQQYGQWLAAGRFDTTEQDVMAREEANRLVGVPQKEEILARYGQ